MYPTTTHYERTQLAIELNNQGVTLIENGKLESAIPILSAALKASEENGTGSLVDEDIAMHSKRTSLDECMVPSSRPNAADVDQSPANDHGQYVYGNCILIPSSSIIANQYESSLPLMVSVAIIFNLALVHQLLAESMDQSEKLLNTALTLYELAYTLQREKRMENTLLFCLATMNNSGLIFKYLNKSESAEMCFQHLLSMLMCLVDCGASEQASKYDGFFRNTSHLIFTGKMAAAA
jgi:tetratricopeptide (TPR) repeat protein